MIAIIDYGMGNLGSVKKKMDNLGIKSIITAKGEEIKNCDKIILPGVGHFSKAVSEIRMRGLWELLSDQVLKEGKLILGICLGMQLMAERSEEGDSPGFGWFDADVVRFKVSNTVRFKIPHTGWNTLIKIKDSELFKDIDMKSEFYFVHSYHLSCNDSSDIQTETIYDYSFVSAIHKENIYGVQFHPEKSHDAGIQLLNNFVSL